MHALGVCVRIMHGFMHMLVCVHRTAHVEGLPDEVQPVAGIDDPKKGVLDEGRSIDEFCMPFNRSHASQVRDVRADD